MDAPPKSSKPATDRETRSCSAGCGPRASAGQLRAFSQNTWGDPLAITLQGVGGALGRFLAEAMGKSAGAWDRGAAVPMYPDTSTPLHWTRARRRLRSGGGYCLAAGPEPALFRHYFWPPEEEEKKAKKGVAVLGGLWPGQDSQACWAREGATVGPKDPGLRRSWQGAGVRGSQGRAQMGHPWPFTCTRASLTAVTCRETEARPPGTPAPLQSLSTCNNNNTHNRQLIARRCPGPSLSQRD